MTGRLRAFFRLYAVQGAWNYERMLGVGMGYAAEPLLEDLRRIDPVRHTEAVVRSAQFFNSHPYLAGLALGASVRAEYDGAPGAQVSRLRTALCSPLGALGDQLFWAGVLPAMVGVTLAAVALGAGPGAVVVFLVAFNLVRAWTAAWALRTGLKTGMRVGSAIDRSLIPRAAAVAGAAAGFAVGVAAPLVAVWLAGPLGRSELLGASGVAAAGVVASRIAGPRYAAPKFALLAFGVTLLFRWTTR
jgi:PTS system mannose-specific IID component